MIEIRYLNKKKQRLNGGTIPNVNTVDEQLIDNIQYNRVKANEFHEGGKICGASPNYLKIEKNSAIKRQN